MVNQASRHACRIYSGLTKFNEIRFTFSASGRYYINRGFETGKIRSGLS